MNFELSITDITPKSKRMKMLKAVRAISQHLGIPVSVADRKKKHNHGEPFFYRAQEELNYRWYNIFSVTLKETYNFITAYFGLPRITALLKADVLTHKGKVLYSPETGEPIKTADWDRFVVLLEKFLNRKLQGTDKKIILESKALGRILNRMLKYNTLEAVKDLPLDDVKYRGKTLDWISDSVKNMQSAMGEELSRGEAARIQVLQQSAAEKITKASAAIKADVRQILIDGVKGRKSKGEISQAIFDRMTGANRDFQRIADTEIQNAANNSFLLDEVNSAEPGERVYFQRIERIDDNTCNFCKKMHGVIVLWSDHPLPSDKINDPIADYAIWDGKDWDGKKEFIANGIFHPYCRGVWVRHNGAAVNALVAELQGKTAEFNSALAKAKNEYKKKGVQTPSDKTPGFNESVNQYYGPELGDEYREKYSLAFKQARMEFEKRGIEYPTGKTPGFRDRIQDIYQELLGKSFNPNQPRDSQGRWAMGADMGGLGSGGREPWHTSTEKARELKADDWGTPDEIAEMARMERTERTAKNRYEAREILRVIAKDNVINGPMTSRSGIKARIPVNNIGKLVSGDAVNESFNELAHYHAVANIDRLFKNAIKKWDFELNPNKNNEGLKNRYVLYSPMEYERRIIPIKITVKEYKDQTTKNKLYSIEAVDAEIEQVKKSGGMLGSLTIGVSCTQDALIRPSKASPIGKDIGTLNPFLDINIAHIFDSVNEYLQKSGNKSVSQRVKEALSKVRM